MTNFTFDPISIKKYIMYEDKKIIAINKPEGLLTIPDGYQKNLPNLFNILKLFIPNLWIVHRLDKLTSGIVLFAKDPFVHKDLNFQFENRSIGKKYIAVTHGFPCWEEKLIDLPLRINGDRRHRTVIDEARGKPARTKVTIIEKNERCSLLSIFPKTGYTHQIRCHLSSIGHLVLGDDLYRYFQFKDQKNTHKYPRLFLHAESITFRLTGESPQTIRANLPKSFYQNFL
jgi:tRNA pseudouridine32 synthase / 23S rRNA pseudouridine746 synthase